MNIWIIMVASVFYLAFDAFAAAEIARDSKTGKVEFGFFLFIAIIMPLVIFIALGESIGRWVNWSESGRPKAESDNPRCFCPDCNADLGNFYSNRIRMERKP